MFGSTNWPYTLSAIDNSCVRVCQSKQWHMLLLSSLLLFLERKKNEVDYGFSKYFNFYLGTALKFHFAP